MNPKILAYAAVSAIVISAVGAGVWYVMAPPKAKPADVQRMEDPGIIEGTTYYPSNFVPAQKVCAQSISDPAYERCTDVAASEGTNTPPFSLKVAPGTYTVFAVLADPSELGLTESRRAYWSAFVQCGMTTDCSSHTHLPVVVKKGTTVVDIRPHDWYD